MSWEDRMNERLVRAVCIITFWNVAMLRGWFFLWFDLGTLGVLIALWTYLDHRRQKPATK